MPVCYADKFQVKKESVVFLFKLDVRLSKTEKIFLAGLSQSSVRINFSSVHVRTSPLCLSGEHGPLNLNF